MAQNIQFISLEYLKTNTAISGNVDAAELTPFIQQAQDIYIQSLLGSRLYEELKDVVYSAMTYTAYTMTQANTDLLALISPCLAYYTLVEALPFQLIKFKNKGLMKPSNPTTGSVSPELREMTYLRQHAKDTAEFYSQRIITFLCNHSEDYPYYSSQGTNADIYPTKKAYNGVGFSFGPKSELDYDVLRRWLDSN